MLPNSTTPPRAPFVSTRAGCSGCGGAAAAGLVIVADAGRVARCSTPDDKPVVEARGDRPAERRPTVAEPTIEPTPEPTADAAALLPTPEPVVAAPVIEPTPEPEPTAAPAVRPAWLRQARTTVRTSYSIKGNINAEGERIYHDPGRQVIWYAPTPSAVLPGRRCRG